MRPLSLRIAIMGREARKRGNSIPTVVKSLARRRIEASWELLLLLGYDDATVRIIVELDARRQELASRVT